MVGRLLGTPFLSVSRTMHCLCLTLGTSFLFLVLLAHRECSRIFVTVNALYKFPAYFLIYIRLDDLHRNFVSIGYAKTTTIGIVF